MPSNSPDSNRLVSDRGGRTIVVALAAAIALGALSSACSLAGTAGEGPIKHETRTTQAFTRIDVGDQIQLVVRIGSAQPLELEAQENLLPIVATDVRNGTLRIAGSRDFTSSHPVVVTIVMPSLDAIAMNDGSQATIDGLDADTFGVDLNGGAGLTATGTVRTVALDGNGGSRASLGDLAAETVVVDLNGGGSATVRASEQVTGDASGGAHLTVLGGARLMVDACCGGAVDRE